MRVRAGRRRHRYHPLKVQLGVCYPYRLRIRIYVRPRIRLRIMANEVARAEMLAESGTLRKTRWGYSRAIVSNEEQEQA